MSVPTNPIKLTPKGRGLESFWRLIGQIGLSGRKGQVPKLQFPQAGGEVGQPMDYGRPPRSAGGGRIGRLWRPGISYWAGPMQWSTQQADYRLYLPPVVVKRLDATPRNLSGMLGRPAHSEWIRIPSVFVPGVQK